MKTIKNYNQFLNEENINLKRNPEQDKKAQQYLFDLLHKYLEKEGLNQGYNSHYEGADKVKLENTLDNVYNIAADMCEQGKISKSALFDFHAETSAQSGYERTHNLKIDKYINN